MIFSNGVLGADEMLGSIEGRLLAYETQIRSRLIADDHPHLVDFSGAYPQRDLINTAQNIIDYTREKYM